MELRSKYIDVTIGAENGYAKSKLYQSDRNIIIRFVGLEETSGLIVQIAGDRSAVTENATTAIENGQ